MFSAHELKNFRRYLETTPKHLWGKPPARGAYDAVGGAAAHGFDRLLAMDFARGGAFDSIGASGGESGAGVEKTLRFLASRLSPADWAEMRQMLCSSNPDDTGSGDPDDATDIGIPRRDDAGLPKNNLAEDSQGYRERFPNAARIENRGHNAPRHARAKAPNAGALADYANRFPGAARIGRV